MPAKSYRGWGKSAEGTTAIEFSLLALPFIMFVIGIIELAVMFAANFVLQGAVQDSARLIRTGQVQQSDGEDPRTMFQEALCRQANIMMSCDDIQFTVKTIGSFTEADTGLDVDDDGNMTDDSFDAGGVSDIVMVQATYLYPVMTPLLGQFFSDYPGNKKLLMSTVVFQTEPYDFEDGE